MNQATNFDSLDSHPAAAGVVPAIRPQPEVVPNHTRPPEDSTRCPPAPNSTAPPISDRRDRGNSRSRYPRDGRGGGRLLSPRRLPPERGRRPPPPCCPRRDPG